MDGIAIAPLADMEPGGTDCGLDDWPGDGISGVAWSCPGGTEGARDCPGGTVGTRTWPEAGLGARIWPGGTDWRGGGGGTDTRADEGGLGGMERPAPGGSVLEDFGGGGGTLLFCPGARGALELPDFGGGGGTLRPDAPGGSAAGIPSIVLFLLGLPELGASRFTAIGSAGSFEARVSARELLRTRGSMRGLVEGSRVGATSVLSEVATTSTSRRSPTAS